MSLFLAFNKVKELLAQTSQENVRVELLQQAVGKSNMLKLSKCGKLVKRRIPFDLKRINRENLDACTVYVENFPESLVIQDIAKIFKRVGEIRNITLPKFGKDSSEE